MEPKRADTLCIELEQLEAGVAPQPDARYVDAAAWEAGSRSTMGVSARLPGVVIGTLAAWDEVGNPLVDFPGNPWDCFLASRSTVPLNQVAVGKQVALMFVDGDFRHPLVIGVIHTPREKPAAEDHRPLSVEADGERLVFTAEKEIVLRCGQASITLTRAGKVLIRGAYLLSRSSGVNRIKGGSVQIN
jgi:hypothetical protein